jgi:hypothetical protein
MMTSFVLFNIGMQRRSDHALTRIESCLHAHDQARTTWVHSVNGDSASAAVPIASSPLSGRCFS